MLLLTRLSARVVHRRRVAADLVWREATRRERDEYLAAVRRILAQARARQS